MAVLAELQTRLTSVMLGLGGVKKSGDLERMLGLDRTLAWQLLKVSESSQPLENAAQVPSRVSMNRFVEGAQSLGVEADTTDALLTAHEAFEDLVQRHSGDRVCFNSMISAAGQGDQWHAKELQHRRNVFRGMSHMLGVQAGMMLRSSILRKMPDNADAMEAFNVGGLIDLRLLWEMERINVYQSRTIRKADDGITYESDIARTTFDGDEEYDKHLLSSYCQPSVPQIEIVEGPNGWVYGNLLNGAVGATAESTVMFGTRYYNIPNPESRERQFGTRRYIDLPIKAYVVDELIEPGFASDWLPNVHVMVGTSLTDHRAPAGIERTLPSRLEMEFLGKGPKPIKGFRDYPQMMTEIGQNAGIDVSQYECWRLRVEYPLYGCTITSELIAPDAPS
ncbi:hypothetical protein GCM10023155_38280 [Bremerella cremea]